MEGRTIYFISGLGADERAFDRLDDFDGWEKVFLKWIPNESGEDIAHYAKRLLGNHHVKSTDVIIGLSFGGLLALGIAKRNHVKSVILISSLRSVKDLKPLWRFMLMTRSYHFIPSFKIAFISKMIRNWFNVRSNQGIKTLEAMVKDSDPKLVKWSIEQIRRAKHNDYSEVQIFNVIGSKDRLINQWESNNTHQIERGGHFMVYEKAKQVNAILRKIIHSMD
ncbi:MAG: alpha/beta hydrolase [Bacteroidetes bacterium]|nr:alpha/beta hydrolase [Bacteroidota bacterium]